MRPLAALASLFAALVADPQALAQSDFDRLYARAEATAKDAPDQRRQAFLAAFDVFSKLTIESDAYRQALPRGALSALHGGRCADAADLLEQQWRFVGPGQDLLTRRLQALSGAGRAHAAVTLARQQESAWADGVRAWIGDLEALSARMAEADRLLLQGHTADGLWVFEAMARIYPNEATLCANLALTHRRLGDLSRAAAGYQRALSLAPQTDWLLTDFGLLWKGQGKPDEAASAFVRGLNSESRPGVSPAGTNLAVLALRTGKDRGRDPVADLRAVVKARPSAAMARRLLLDLLPRKRR